MNMKYSFGKGLESLIPKKTPTSHEQETKKEVVFYIEVEKIKPNPYQPRKEFDQEGLQTLADSIKEHGILQPLIVTRVESEGSPQYQLIAGERRLLAAKMAGLSQVPVIIREPSQKEKLIVSLVENAQRLDLNPLEKAEAYQRLQKEFGLSQAAIGKLVGKSRVAVTNTLRLRDLPEEIKQGIRQEKISEGHARAMLMTDSSNQKTLFSKILKEGLSVRESEDWAQKLNVWKPSPKEKVSPHLHQEVKELEQKFKEIFDLKDVYFRIISGKPKLTVFFKSKQEVEDLIKRIGLS